MGVVPINVGRVSFNLRAFTLLNSVRANQVGLFRTQNQLATGLRFLAPSEEPRAAGQSIRLDRRLDLLRKVGENLRDVNATLTSVEAALQEGSDLLIEAHNAALEATSDSATPDERQALATVIDSILDRLVALGNRTHLGNFLFSGHQGDPPPFLDTGNGVLYLGDDGRRETIVDSDLSQQRFTISGQEFFNAVSQAVHGTVDLDPQATLSTRIVDLRGAVGTGVSLGQILVSDGSQQTTVDLSSAATLGDLIDLLNAQMPDTLEATLVGNSIQIQRADRAPGDITIIDVAGGTTAADLGIFANSPQRSIAGADLDPILTPRTGLTQLLDGAGVDLSGGLRIRNGSELATIDFAGATTIEDLLNRINQSNVGVLARISDDGRTIEVLNRTSGADLRIEENGGSAATVLGIRSLYAGTRMSALNDGLGVDSVDGDDFRITTADGSTIDLDVNDLDLSAATLQDLLDLINAAGGGRISASLATTGNGIVITDNTVGAGTLTIERLNVSPTIDSLGLNVTASGNQLVGQDVNPIRVDSAFTALLELKWAMAADDAQSISLAAQRLERALDRLQDVQGQVAALARANLERAERIDNETTAAQILQSEVRDVDLAEAVVRFQQLQTALQANLATGSRILSLSLLDYLR